MNNIIKKAAELSGIKKKVTAYVLRHSFATHLSEQGTNLRIIQQLLGQESGKTTEIYIYVNTKTLQDTQSPLDKIMERKTLKNNNLSLKIEMNV